MIEIMRFNPLLSEQCYTNRALVYPIKTKYVCTVEKAVFKPTKRRFIPVQFIETNAESLREKAIVFLTAHKHIDSPISTQIDHSKP
jgi:hypothetical protein